MSKRQSATSKPENMAAQFVKLRQEIASISKKLDALRAFITEISQIASFDKEDVAQTVQTYKTLAMTLQEKEETLKYREELYHQHIVKLNTTIVNRQQFLEKVGSTDLFETFPELLAFYVEKQAILTNSLDQLKSKLDN